MTKTEKSPFLLSVSAMTLRVREPHEEEYELVLEPPQEPSRKPSVHWLAAFKKVTPLKRLRF